MRRAIVLFGLAALFHLLAGCRRPAKLSQAMFSPEEIRQILKLSPLPNLPPNPTNAVADNPLAARLGQRLFFERRLSANAEVSCATCHDPQRGFSDAKPLARGLGAMERHTPSLWNVAYQRWFTWNGRADSMWAQALQPMLHQAEMGASPERLHATVSGDPVLKAEYEQLFGPIPGALPDGSPSADRFLAQLGKAIEAYQRQIISSGSPFDQFVEALRKGERPTRPGRSMKPPSAA
jgi:cytochrome c peroxidase